MHDDKRNVVASPEIKIDRHQSGWVKPKVTKLDLETAQVTGA